MTEYVLNSIEERDALTLNYLLPGDFFIFKDDFYTKAPTIYQVVEGKQIFELGTGDYYGLTKNFAQRKVLKFNGILAFNRGAFS